MYKLERMR